jgi:hypothetical protein
MKSTRDENQQVRLLKVEFIGGPYDGHQEPCFTRPDHLPADVVWFVCEDVFRLLNGKGGCLGGSLTSVALYELELATGECRYRFTGAISIKEITRLMSET